MTSQLQRPLLEGERQRCLTPVPHLADVVRGLLANLDNFNFDAIPGYLAPSAPSVWELSWQWIRSRSSVEFHDHFGQLRSRLSDITSRLDDVHAVVWGDMGVVTFWLERDYLLDGEPQHVSAPTTMVLRRHNGDWKIRLVHSTHLVG